MKVPPKDVRLGLDIQLAGIVIARSDLDERLRKICRDTGSALSGRSVSLLPALTFDIYQARLLQFTNNAEKIFEGLRPALSHVADVAYPLQWRQYCWGHRGALVTIDFIDGGLNNKEGLDACIELALQLARWEGFPITKGAGFGYSASRISASFTMAEDSDPFLRISVGIESGEVDALVVVVNRATLQCAKRYSG
ncbi:uncharacterized protein BO88DRAFT_489050 [Aspergillus vadensis CBS 113365]|uniref:PLP-dependent transferase n=1 Tax=Aspergillus vadensis (strain CBS 113365 / IMI 142717 / IBT 24658) TaxID=1448311 RepID=A0A319BPB4_ASPVC|nr:hypothetical protein BO88DRAFT_489050 [Aspergillus vadensis CBS 113365]PYH67553.1 hypothetical protein BO88DRAFT_489050 [Aspergillus vadensis CBS 113365]